MNNIFRLIIFVFVFSSTNALASDTSENNWNYSIGLAAKQLSLEVSEKDRSHTAGILTEDFLIVPELGVESIVNYFSDTSWGYKYAFNFSFFEMKTQEVEVETAEGKELKDVNLGTSAKGYYLYAMPVGVYDFLKNTPDSSLLVGIGVGLGYLNARGDIILTEATPQTRHSFAFSELSFSVGLLLEFKANSWSFNINAYAPAVSDAGYDYQLNEVNISIRKMFSF